MKKIVFIFLTTICSIIFSNTNVSHSWCGITELQERDFDRFEYLYPQYMDSTHYRVHFTTEPADSFFWNNAWMTHESTIEYAITVLEQAEFTYSVFENDGWEMPPLDCDDSILDTNNPNHCNNYGGNSLYDIYIGLVQGPAALVSPENSNNELPYIGGLSSYILFANGLGLFGSMDDLASINYYIVAHEIHHSIQFAYGPSFTGTPQNPIHQLWMFEQTATFLENFIYPNSIHLRLLLSNCNIDTPLTHPELGVYQSYAGALWQIFLTDYLNNSNLIKYFWESYGERINNGEIQITFFDIFNNQILEISNDSLNLEDMYKEYAIWRYFTGERAIPNQYFDEANLYCSSSILQIPDNSIQLQSELGGNHYIELPNENIYVNIQSENIISLPGILINSDNENYITFSDLELLEGNNIINVDSEFNGEHVLVLTSGYTANELNFENINISFEIDTNNNLGDINNDQIINVLDIILLVDSILLNEYQFIADLNNDGFLNVIDVVLLINIILN